MRKPAPQFFELADVRRLVAKWSIDCGAAVCHRREELGWTRLQLAQIVGCTEATVSRVESGKLNPRDHLKLAIAAALQREVSELWDYPKRQAVYETAAVA